jgi:hypothetical protein
MGSVPRFVVVAAERAGDPALRGYFPASKQAARLQLGLIVHMRALPWRRAGRCSSHGLSLFLLAFVNAMGKRAL